jgi:hypothetical protein
MFSQYRLQSVILFIVQIQKVAKEFGLAQEITVAFHSVFILCIGGVSHRSYHCVLLPVFTY